MGSVVLAGVQRRSVVQMVDLGKRPGSMRVPVHRRRDSVHPTVMGQLIVLGMKSEQKKKKKKKSQPGLLFLNKVRLKEKKQGMPVSL